MPKFKLIIPELYVKVSIPAYYKKEFLLEAVSMLTILVGHILEVLSQVLLRDQRPSKIIPAHSKLMMLFTLVSTQAKH